MPQPISLWNDLQCMYLKVHVHVFYPSTRENSDVMIQALNFALEGAQQFSPGKGHFYNVCGKCKFVLELCKGHHSKSTGHPRQLLWVPWVNSRPDDLKKNTILRCT